MGLSQYSATTMTIDGNEQFSSSFPTDSLKFLRAQLTATQKLIIINYNIMLLCWLETSFFSPSTQLNEADEFAEPKRYW